MKKTASVYLVSLLSLCVSVTRPAFPTPLTDLLNAPLSEAGVNNIEGHATALPIFWAIGDAAVGAVDNHFTVDSQYQRYISGPQAVRSETCEVSGFSDLTIYSPEKTGPPGSTWIPFGYPGEIGANISRNNLLDSCHLPATNASNAGNPVDMGFTSKDYDYLISASDNYDWMFTILTLYGCDVASSALGKTC